MDAPQADGGVDAAQDMGMPDTPVGPSPDGGVDGPGDGGDGSTPITSCLDQPTELPRPPIGPLPCELIPPGLML